MPTSGDTIPDIVLEALDALPCGALLIGRDRRIRFANARLAEMTGRPVEQIVGSDVAALYPDAESRECLHEFFADFDRMVEREFHVPRADGSRRPVMMAGRLMCLDPPWCDVRIVTLLDIAPLKAAQERAQEQYREIVRLSDTVLEQALDLKDYSKTLEKRVHQRTQELREANLEAIWMLAVAAEARDDDTGAHVLRICDYAVALARALGLSEGEAEHLGRSAILHDVGKLNVPDHILKKPGPLDEAERAEMTQHTLVGERILSKKPFFNLARQIARSHHENWDGSGYPDGLRGEAIPLPARVVHLADVFDALTSRRPYKQPWPPEQAVGEIRAASGRMFDPALVDKFLELVNNGAWAEIHKRHDTGG